MTWDQRDVTTANVKLGVEWNETGTANTSTTFTIAPEIFRWDKYTTDNYGSYLADSLYPNADSGGTGYWDGYRYPSGGQTWRSVDSFQPRMYNKQESARTLTLKVYTDSEFGTIFDDLQFHTIGEETRTFTLTIPKLQSWSVTYNANGGSGAPSNQTKYRGKDIKLSSTKPTRTGYTFKGWATSSSGSVSYAAGAIYSGNAALSLYAVWQANTYTVSYNANGHGSAPSDQTKTYGVALTLRGSMGTVGNYAFKNWNTASGGGGTSYAAGASYTGNAALSLWAQWYAPYTVSYNANGGTGAPSNQTKVHGTSLTLSTATPTRTNYVFKNWNTNSGGTGTSYNPGSSYTGNAALTLYAQWYAPYTVTYDANGGTGAPSAGTKVYNAAYTVSNTVPTRAGFNFEGWNTMPAGTGTAYASGGTVAASVNQNMTLYAQWTVAHEPPTISSLRVQRCDSQGTLSDDGEYVKVTASWSVDDTEASSAVITLDGHEDPLTLSGTLGTIEHVHETNGSPTQISVTQSYPVTIVISDSKGYSTTRTSTVSVAFFTMNFQSGGKGIAFGKKSTRDGFDVDMDMYAKNLAVSNDFSAVDGSFSGDIDAVNATFSGDIGADNATFTGDISADGGTLSGRLNIVDWQFTGVSTGIDRDGAAPSTDQYGGGSVLFEDKDGERIGFVRPVYSTAERMSIQLCALSENGGGNEIYNSLFVGINKDGTPSYSMSSPSAFRDALELGAPIKDTSPSSIFTANTSNITVTAANYAQWGHLAALFIRFTNNNAISVPASGSIGNIDIGTLAEGKRPRIVTAPVSEGDGAGIVHYYIYENGKVMICGVDTRGSAYSIAAGTTFYLYGTYMLP